MPFDPGSDKGVAQRLEEEALRLSEERFRLLVDSVQDYGIFMLDPAGRVASWNTGAERINGYRAEEVIGRHFSIFYPQEARDSDYPSYELRMAAKEGRFEDEGWRVRKDGSRFWANVVITALRGPTGELTGYAKVARDLTSRRAAEEQARRLAAEEAARAEAERRSIELERQATQLVEQALELELQTEEARRLAERLEIANTQLTEALAEAQEARRSAEAANAAKTQFLAVMSHELRTPLNAIGGYAELLEMGVRGPVTDEQRDDLMRIIRNERHLLGVINDILNYAKLESGHIEYSITLVPVDETLRELNALVAPQLTARELAYEYVGCDPTIRARADAEKMRQVLLNLLSNAIKFTEPGGHIRVSCAVDDGIVAIEVRDTGVGIPAARLDEIFEPFVQLNRNLASAHEGTGLGLAISRDLARGMGGDITVASRLGKGSTFVLTIPRGEDADYRTNSASIFR